MEISEHQIEQRFCEWVGRFQPLVFKVVHGFVSTAQDREELFQEILVQLWRSAARFNGDCGASTWVYRVAFQTAMAWRRSENRRSARRSEGIDWESLAAPVEEQPEAIERLYWAIRQLSKPEAALIMMHLDGLSYREMAEVMGISEVHVGTKLTRVRARLRELMKGASDE
jgi:RNA polymerase sigma-70 factor (ECF subfamily)